MPELIINGVPIHFPVEPYEVQTVYMSKVLECLQQRLNGVLESPTGTGKTLSLLCSSLGWLAVKKAQVQAKAQGIHTFPTEDGDFVAGLHGNLERSAGSSSTSQEWGNISLFPKIIYASRTHSQLSQAMGELKRTKYSHVKVAVLGSRDQLCIHPQVAAEPNSTMKLTLCRMHVANRSCHFYNNVEVKKTDPLWTTDGLLDIEDLAKRGRKLSCCPYYIARDLQQEADIVFMPYNYLLDHRTRKAQDVKLAGNVVLLDEGHNVEKMCEELASAQLTSTDIALCINEVTQVMEAMYERTNNPIQMAMMSDNESLDFSAEDLCLLKTMLIELEKAVDAIQLPSGCQKGGFSQPGSFVFELLSKAELTFGRQNQANELIQRVSQFLSTTSESPVQRRGSSLIKFADFVKVVFGSLSQALDFTATDKCYKVYIEPEVDKKVKNNSWSTARETTKSDAKIINFWCFSPSFGMRTLLEQGVHCVVLTSGTLSPLNATISELGIPIGVQLENPHIITQDQVCVSVLHEGPSCKALRSTFENRDKPEYLTELGLTLQNFTRIIPDGLLMFFPSYAMLKKTVDHWQQTGLWSRIITIKPIFVEPQRREELTGMMTDYYKAIDENGVKGAVLLAVLRGKVSEGLDFANTRGRAVLITGLPYPPFKDPRVMLKREHLDNCCNDKAHKLTGSQWYQVEATRAVNQAMGRVIRHAQDYGAIVLCDERFSGTNIINSLSAWLRPHIKKDPFFGQAFGRIRVFFRNAGDLSPLQPAVVQSASFNTTSQVAIHPLRMKKRAKQQLTAAEQMDVMKQEYDSTWNKEGEQVTKKVSPPVYDKTKMSMLEYLNSNEQDELNCSSLLRMANVVNSEPVGPQLSALLQPGPSAVPPAKRQKLRVVPLKFEDTTVEESQDAKVTRRHNEIEKYLLMAQKALNKTNYSAFVKTIVDYKDQENYEALLGSLKEIFPPSNKHMEHLFRGFYRFLASSEHKTKFKSFCDLKYGKHPV